MKQKVFLLSFHKTGTRSFTEFMRQHGFSAIHYPREIDGRELEREIGPFRDDPAAVVRFLAPVIDKADVHADVPWPGLFPQLMKDYPNAKFVINSRDPEGWANAVAHHWSLDYISRRLSNFEYCQYKPYLGERARAVFKKGDLPLLINALLAHHAEVLRTIPAERLFSFNLGEAGVGPRLAAFLGFQTDAEMPVVGKRKKTQLGRLKKNLRRRFWIVDKLMSLR